MRARLAAVAAGWISVVLALLVVHVVLPQRSGPLALTQVLEPYIVLTAVLACPLALIVRARPAALAVAVLLLAAVFRYGPGWLSMPAPASPAGETIRVVSWNLLAAGEGATRAVAGLHEANADLIGVQELQADAARALAEDPTLLGELPYRVLEPESTVLGMGLMSRYPILEYEVSTDPPYLTAVVDPPSSEPVGVVVFHPLPARFATFLRVPVALDTTRRDAAIAEIRAAVEAHLAARRPVVALGDLNTTEREPAWAEFAAGLHDAHLDAGLGPGFTWRPPALESLPLGLLRIDYVFFSPELAAASSSVDCSLPSDHCRLDATLVRLSGE